MAPKSNKSFAKATTKLGLATTIAALLFTAVPLASAVADVQISARGGASAVQPLSRTISATRLGQHPNPTVSVLHGPTRPTGMIGESAASAPVDRRFSV